MDIESSDPSASTGSDHASSSDQADMEGTPVANQGIKQEERDVEVTSSRDAPPTPTPTASIPPSLRERPKEPETDGNAEPGEIISPNSTLSSGSEHHSFEEPQPVGLNPLFEVTPAALETPAAPPPDTPMEHAASTPRPMSAMKRSSEPPGARSESPISVARPHHPSIPVGTSYSQLAHQLASPQSAEWVTSSFSRNAAAARRTTRGSIAAAAAAAHGPEQTPQATQPLEPSRKPGSVRASMDAWLEPNDPNWTLPPPQLGVSLAQIAPPGSTVLTWMRLTRYPIIWDGKTDAGGKSGRNLVLIGYAAGKVSINGKLPARGEEDPTAEGLHLLQDCDPDKKPSYSYSLITRFAILGSPYKSLSLSEIYMILEAKFPWFAKEEMKWRDSIRYNLSSNNWFVKTKRALHQPGVGNLWTVDEQSIGGPKRPRKGRSKPWADADEEEDEISGDDATPNPDTRIISSNSNGSMMLTFDSKQRASSENRQTGRGSSVSSAASVSPPVEAMDGLDRYADARDSTFVRAGMTAFHATKAAKENASKKTPLPPWMMNDHEHDMDEGIGSGRDEDEDDFEEDEGYPYDYQSEGQRNLSDEDVEMSERVRQRVDSFTAFSNKLKQQTAGVQPTTPPKSAELLAKWDGKTVKKKPSITLDDGFLRGNDIPPEIPIRAPGYDSLMRDGRGDTRKATSTQADSRTSMNTATLWNSHLSSKPPGAGFFPSLNSLENPRPKRDSVAPNPGHSGSNETESSAHPTSPWKAAPDSRKRTFASISPTRVSTDARKQKLRKVQNDISQRRHRVQTENPFSASRSSTVGTLEGTARPLSGQRSMPPPPNPTSAFTFTTSTVQRKFTVPPAGSASEAPQSASASSSVFGKPAFSGSAKGLFSFLSPTSHKGAEIDPMQDPRRDPARLRSLSRGREELESSSEDEATKKEIIIQPRERRDSTLMETSDDDGRSYVYTVKYVPSDKFKERAIPSFDSRAYVQL
ncbi:Forkhead box protein I2 [Serendipita sp. 399]|nr:Forkhead box protein I2 [Serendipita sp. 399]